MHSGWESLYLIYRAATYPSIHGMKKIGLIGDPHAKPEPVQEAIDIFHREQVDVIWCTGDIAGYGEQLEQTVHVLKEHDCQGILGNHEIWTLEKQEQDLNTETLTYLYDLPLIWQQQMEGKRLYMVHASPPDSMMKGIRLLDQNGNIIEAERQLWSERLTAFEQDVLIIGHTHQVFAERLAETLVINPGSTQFNHSCAILFLPSLDVQWFPLSGQTIQKSWNWGQEYHRQFGDR
jgi:putative phosphoesterase